MNLGLFICFTTGSSILDQKDVKHEAQAQ